MAGDTSNLTDPYIQLLSLTFEEDAHADFVTVRMNGTDTSATQAPLLSTAPYWGIDDDVFGYGSAGGVNMGPRGEGEDGEESIGYVDGLDGDGDGDNGDSDDSDEPDDTDFLGDGSGSTKAANSSDDSSNSGATSPSSSSSKKPWYKTRWFHISAAALGGIAVLAALGFAMCICLRRRRSSLKTEKAFIPPMAGAGAYKPLKSESNLHQHHGNADPPTYGAGHASGPYSTGAYAYVEPKYHYGSA